MRHAQKTLRGGIIGERANLGSRSPGHVDLRQVAQKIVGIGGLDCAAPLGGRLHHTEKIAEGI